MATIISTKTSGVGGLSVTGDASGILQLASADGTTALTIDASQNVGIGVSNPSSYGILTAYSASNPTLTIASGNANAYLRLNTTSDLNMYLTNTGGSMTMNTANTERMRINSLGNVGIGTSSPAAKLDVYGYAHLGQAGVGADISFLSTSYGFAGWYGGTAPNGNSTDANLGVGAIQFTGGGSNGLTFLTSPNTAVGSARTFTERMRIDSSGNLLVGTTSALSTGSISFVASGAGGAAMLAARNSATAGGKFWTFGPDNGNAFRVFNQTPNGVYVTDGATSWSAFSDERLKTDLIPIANGLEKVNSLRSVTGRFKTDEEGVSRSFLIAQDVQKVLPEAVSVQDDELGTLGVAYTEVIPLLVASIKELKAIIDTQNARITTLEGG